MARELRLESKRILTVIVAAVLVFGLLPLKGYGAESELEVQSYTCVLSTGVPSEPIEMTKSHVVDYVYEAESDGVYWFNFDGTRIPDGSVQFFLSMDGPGGDELYYRVSETGDKFELYDYGPFVLEKGRYVLTVTSSIRIYDFSVTAHQAQLDSSIGEYRLEREDNSLEENFESLYPGASVLATIYTPKQNIGDIASDYDIYHFKVTSPEDSHVTLTFFTKQELMVNVYSDPSRETFVDGGFAMASDAPSTKDYGNLPVGDYYVSVSALHPVYGSDVYYNVVFNSDGAVVEGGRSSSGGGGNGADGSQQGSSSSSAGGASSGSRVVDQYSGVLRDDGYVWTCNSLGEPISRVWGDYGDWYSVRTLYVDAYATTVPKVPRFDYGSGEENTSQLYKVTPGVQRVVFKLDGKGESAVTNLEPRCFELLSGISSLENFEKTHVKLISDEAFRGCSSLASVNIPQSVTVVSNEAFYGCYELSSVSLPKSCHVLDHYAFRDCYSLKSITINSDSVISAGYEPLYGTPFKDSSVKDAYIYVKGSLIASYKSSDDWSAYKSRLRAIPGTEAAEPSARANVKANAKCAVLSKSGHLLRCSSAGVSVGAKWAKANSINKVTTLYIDSSVKTVPYYMFYEYGNGSQSEIFHLKDSKIKKIVFLTKKNGKSSCKKIENTTFSRMKHLTTVKNLEKTSLKKINDLVFAECAKLKTIGVPKTLRSIGEYSFAYCTKLKKVAGLNGKSVKIDKTAFLRTKVAV